MKRRKITTVLALLLLIAGLGILLFPKASDLFTRYQLSKKMDEYNRNLASVQKTADYSNDWAAAEDYNRWLLEKDVQLVADQSERDRAFGLLNPLGTGMMGTIEIPAIDINLPIYQGTDEKMLQSGAGWWVGSSLPTGGPSNHTILTAHTGLVKASLFSNLDRLEIGDVFFIRVLDRNLAYEVDQIKVVLPEETEDLVIQDGEDYATLYTCTPYGVNTHRLLVRGKRTTWFDGMDAQLVSKQLFYRLLIWIAAAAAILLLLILFFWRRKKRREKLAEEDDLTVQG